MTQLQIEAFLAVQKAGTITEAAASLMISQSSLSVRLRSLEEELGCALFTRNRGSRSLRLTSEGERFLQLANQYENLLDRMYSLSSPKAAPLFRVSSLNSLSLLFFPRVYDLFMLRRPDVRLELQNFDTENAGYNIERGKTDLAFITGEYSSTLVATIPVFSEPMVLVASADNPCPDTVTAEDLDPDDEVFVYWGAPFYAWHTSLFGIDAMPRLSIATMEQLYYFLREKRRWAAVPLSISELMEGRGEFRLLETSIEMPFRLTKCMVNATIAESPIVTEFLDCTRQAVRELKDSRYQVLL